jgi:acyl-[acyl-carrier-protein] desaturase
VLSSSLEELAPVVGKLLDRHLSSAREWFPHELVPWERASQIVAGQPWEPPDGVALPDGISSAIFVNLLTEDNLPYYTRALGTAFGVDGGVGRVDVPMDGRGRTSFDRPS